jgi:uncharacterized membrane protein
MLVISILVLVASIIWTAIGVSSVNKESREQDDKLRAHEEKLDAMAKLVKRATENYQKLEDAIVKDMAYIKEIHNKTMEEVEEFKSHPDPSQK